MTDYRDDIEKYLKGELTPAGMHALEKKALSDPFLADALEGAEHIGATEFSKDITALNESILKRKTASTWAWPVRIAAGILLLAVSSFIMWIAFNQEPEQNLALEQTATANDSLTNPAEQTNPAPATNESLSTASSTQQDKKVSDPPPAKQPIITSKKPSNEQVAQNKKTELAPELSKTVTENNKPLDDKLSTPSREDRFEAERKRSVKTIDPNTKDLIQSPSAAEIRNAEGYIASVDARPTIVTGRVMSAEDGTPLPDVSIALKGTSVTTKTDAHGRYAIAADSRNQTLVYSSEGLESTEVKIEGVDSTYLPVKLEITEEAQEEAVVETSGMRDFGPTHVYTIPAHPETGNRAFKQYLEKTHKYPKEAKETKVEGIVTIEFKVDATGALSEFKILRGIGTGCDEELIRLILQGAPWVPTTKDGLPVSDKARVKFKFELEE
jgi:TonB family protein